MQVKSDQGLPLGWDADLALGILFQVCGAVQGRQEWKSWAQGGWTPLPRADPYQRERGKYQSKRTIPLPSFDPLARKAI